VGKPQLAGPRDPRITCRTPCTDGITAPSASRTLPAKKQFPDPARAHDRPAADQRPARRPRRIPVPGPGAQASPGTPVRFLPKVKSYPTVIMRPAAVMKDGPGEFLRGPSRRSPGRTTPHETSTRAPPSRGLFLDRGDLVETGTGGEEADRVRRERHHYGNRAQFPRMLQGSPDQFPVGRGGPRRKFPIVMEVSSGGENPREPSIYFILIKYDTTR